MVVILFRSQYVNTIKEKEKYYVGPVYPGITSSEQINIFVMDQR